MSVQRFSYQSKYLSKIHLPIRIPPRYNLNIVESGIEHYKPKSNQSESYTDIIIACKCKIRK